MKRIIAALLVTSALSAPAMAADVYGKDSLKDSPASASVNSVDFSGPYIGIGFGGEFANTELDLRRTTFDGIGSDGLVGDAVLGYDFRAGSFVFGPRVQFGITNVDTTIGSNDLLTLDYFINLGGRAGVVFNRTLFYAHGGYEMMFASSDNAGYDQWLDDADLNAFTVGLGVETAISSNLSLGLEGAYIYGVDDAEGTEAFRGMARINLRR